jgi:hypothetical protein
MMSSINELTYWGVEQARKGGVPAPRPQWPQPPAD